MGEKTCFRFEMWGSVGASDWKFSSLKPSYTGSEKTFFVPELNISPSFGFFGANIGFTYYYYFDGSGFFDFRNVSPYDPKPNSTQIEVWGQYDFETLLHFSIIIQMANHRGRLRWLLWFKRRFYPSFFYQRQFSIHIFFTTLNLSQTGIRIFSLEKSIHRLRQELFRQLYQCKIGKEMEKEDNHLCLIRPRFHQYLQFK